MPIWCRQLMSQKLSCLAYGWWSVNINWKHHFDVNSMSFTQWGCTGRAKLDWQIYFTYRYLYYVWTCSGPVSQPCFGPYFAPGIAPMMPPVMPIPGMIFLGNHSDTHFTFSVTSSLMLQPQQCVTYANVCGEKIHLNMLLHIPPKMAIMPQVFKPYHDTAKQACVWALLNLPFPFILCQPWQKFFF